MQPFTIARNDVRLVASRHVQAIPTSRARGLFVRRKPTYLKCASPAAGSQETQPQAEAEAAPVPTADPIPPTSAAAPTRPPLGEEPPKETPWQLGFQTNERNLQWDGSAQRQLVKIYACNQLGLSQEQLEARIEDLAVLLPDMASKVEAIKGDILVGLLQDVHGLAWKLLGLKELLPSANVSMLVARHPALVLQYSKEEVAQRLEGLRQHLPGVRLEALLEVEPLHLEADISAVLAEIRRLLPNADPVKMLVSDPLAVLDMAQAGQASSNEVQVESP